MLLGNKRYSISPEEYVFATLNIYLDIIYLFSFLLQIMGGGREWTVCTSSHLIKHDRSTSFRKMIFFFFFRTCSRAKRHGPCFAFCSVVPSLSSCSLCYYVQFSFFSSSFLIVYSCAGVVFLDWSEVTCQPQDPTLCLNTITSLNISKANTSAI